MKADAVLVRDGTRRLVAMGLSEAFLLGCGFILQCLLARCLDPDNYGILAALNVAVLFPLLLAAGGMPRAARNLVGSTKLRSMALVWMACCAREPGICREFSTAAITTNGIPRRIATSPPIFLPQSLRAKPIASWPY